MPSLQTLASMAGFGAVAVLGTGYWITWKFQQQVRETKTYRKLQEILNSNEKVVQHLGEPIKHGRIKFYENQDNIRNFSINLTGSRTKGILNCKVHLLTSDVLPEISKLEIQFSDIPDRLYTLYKNEELEQ